MPTRDHKRKENSTMANAKKLLVIVALVVLGLTGCISDELESCAEYEPQFPPRVTVVAE